MLQVVFLCGVTGERMFPIAGDKFLLKFLGQTLLEHQIEQALAAGLNDVVIVGNRQNIERLKEFVPKFPRSRIGLAIQGEPSGMADAVQRTPMDASGPFPYLPLNSGFRLSKKAAIPSLKSWVPKQIPCT